MRRICLSVLFFCVGGAAASAQTTAPETPHVDDPLLAPPSPPARVLGSWEDAYRLLSARSTQLRIAIAEVEKAEGAARISLAAMLPQINGTGTFTHHLITQSTPIVIGTITATDPTTGLTATLPQLKNITSPQSDYFSGNIAFSQSVVHLANWHNYGTARRNTDASKISLEDTKRVLIGTAANAIVAVVTAERVAELNRVSLRQALERHAIAKRRFELGAANGLDLVRAEQDTTTTRTTLVSGDESLRQARESLGLALGVPEQVSMSPSIQLDSLLDSARRVCSLTNRLDDRSDIAAADAKLRVAKRSRENITYQYVPSLAAQSTLTTTTADVGSAPNTTWNIQGVLSVPIWDGGSRYGNQRSYRALETEAEQTLESTRRSAVVQVDQSKRGVSVAEQSLAIAKTSRDLALEEDRLTRIAFQEGRGTSLELVVAAGALRQAEISLVLKEFELIRARIAQLLAMSNCTL